MFNVEAIAKNQVYYIKKLEQRGIKEAKKKIVSIVNLNLARKKLKTAVDEQAHSLKKLSQELQISFAKKETEVVINEKKLIIRDLKRAYKTSLTYLKNIEANLRESLELLPNMPNPEVPVGIDATDNKVYLQKGEAKAYGVPHWELLKKYKLADFESGNKVTGAGFTFFIGRGARFVRTLIHFLLDQAVEAGYQEIMPPIVVNEASARGTGQLPDKEGTMYHITGDNLFLIPTAEVPLTNLYAQAILQEEKLPIKLTAYTPCFRREAGSWGSHVRGLNRLKQFDKVELVEICTPEDASRRLDQMLFFTRSILEGLGLTYRVLDLCTADLGHTAARTFDLEVWAPGQKKWLEVSSVSHFGDYQSRRMQLKYRDANKKKHYCHTLNGSAFGIPRLLVALLESYQKENKIEVPPILKSRFGETYIT